MIGQFSHDHNLKPLGRRDSVILGIFELNLTRVEHLVGSHLDANSNNRV